MLLVSQNTPALQGSSCLLVGSPMKAVCAQVARPNSSERSMSRPADRPLAISCCTKSTSGHRMIPSTSLLARSRPTTSPSDRKLPETPRRPNLPPDPGTSRRPSEVGGGGAPPVDNTGDGDKEAAELSTDDPHHDGDHDDDESVWSTAELEAISALFDRPMPQKPLKPAKVRPLPLPAPHKTRPPGVPTPKRHVRSASRSLLAPRSSFADRVWKNPEALVGIAAEIGALPANRDASEVLDRWARFLRKGSLSMTVRELGHMGLPERALQTLCWAQKQPSLFPDDRTLASTVQVLARCGQLKMAKDMDTYLNSANRTVIEAIIRGFLKGGQLRRARRFLLFAKDHKITLDPSIYAKVIAEAGNTRDGYRLASRVLNELGEREDFDLTPQDCTAVMKVCTKLGMFAAVQNLFDWYKQSGRNPTVVMYTTVIHSRCCEKKHREALELLWEMESSGCVLDLPAYVVVISLLVALNDLGRAVRYFSKLKDAGLSPTTNIYHDMINVYAASGRLAKCKQLRKEAEMFGLRLDGRTLSLLSELELQVLAEG